jgi:hypothetical protein
MANLPIAVLGIDLGKTGASKVGAIFHVCCQVQQWVNRAENPRDGLGGEEACIAAAHGDDVVTKGRRFQARRGGLMLFDGAGKTLVATQSLIVLGMIEAFFEGGARWARRTYCTADGKRCLLGAIEHIRGETGLADNRAAEYLAGAINLRQLSKGLPPLGDKATVTAIGSMMHLAQLRRGRRGPERSQKTCPERHRRS